MSKKHKEFDHDIKISKSDNCSIVTYKIPLCWITNKPIKKINIKNIKI